MYIIVCMSCSSFIHIFYIANNNSAAQHNANVPTMLTTADGQQLSVTVLPPPGTPDKNNAVSLDMTISPAHHTTQQQVNTVALGGGSVQERLVQASPAPTQTPGVGEQERSELTELRPVPTDAPTVATTTYLPMGQYISKSTINIGSWDLAALYTRCFHLLCNLLKLNLTCFLHVCVCVIN